MAAQKPLERYGSFLKNVYAVKSDQELMTSCEIGLVEHVAWPLGYITQEDTHVHEHSTQTHVPMQCM